MSAKDLARILTAVGSIRDPEEGSEGFYLLTVNDGNLVEKLWQGDVVKTETVISTDAKENTAASYLLSFTEDEIQRRVVFIDQFNSLQCYHCDDEMQEWEDTELGKKWNITVSPRSKLSATIGPHSGPVISYQDAAGHLNGIIALSKDEWKKFGPLKADPILGTPQVLEVIDEKLHLFYVGKDSCVHYQVSDSKTNNWQDNLLKNTNFESPIENFMVTKIPDTNIFQSYYISESSLWIIKGDKKTRLGQVNEGGKFTPIDNAQAGWTLWFPTPRRIRFYADGSADMFF